MVRKIRDGRTFDRWITVILRLALSAAMGASLLVGLASAQVSSGKVRVIATTDGEIDDRCSMVRFLLCANEFEVEGIILSSSQYHWRGHRWAGDDWVDRYLDAYEQVYPNLIKHDPSYPTPEYLRSVTFVGNVDAEGEMDAITPGSKHIVRVLLDDSDDRPIWLQAWGGPNTIARALKTIEERYPERMEEVAKKINFFFIWEQDTTYQAYIKPHWGEYNITTIISDQFEAIAYRWKRIVPKELQKYLEAKWMKENILENHGPLCALYEAHAAGDEGFEEGDFRSEGDSPSFLHCIVTGLRNLESPDWGGWGGRYVRVRDNVWLDPVPEEGSVYPEGRWYTHSAWGRQMIRKGETSFTNPLVLQYYKPMWRWIEAIQNDFAARADWCVKPYEEANHPPIVRVAHPVDLVARPGETVRLSAAGTYDPDGDSLAYRWWQYCEADTYDGEVAIENARQQTASFKVPHEARNGETIHIVCEVRDDGLPPLTRYKRIVVTVRRD